MSVTSPRAVILCGPSGSGKSTIIKEVMNKHPGCFGFSVSHTTRKPRYGEQSGVAYHFVSVEEMKDLIEKNEFIEHAEFSGNMYGTSKRSIEKLARKGKICLLDIDKQGVLNVKKTDLDARYVFIKPPSYEELEKRLRARGSETEDKITQRLACANEELKFGATEGVFDIVIVNDDLHRAAAELEEFLKEDIDLAKAKLNG